MLNSRYWTERYQNSQTQWDIGFASPAIIDFVKENFDFDTKILIPGAGNAYEVEVLFNLGFKNVFLLDFSELPIQNFLNRNPNFPIEQILMEDFFEHNASYDLIIEQTFFCAIDRNLRGEYARKMHALLTTKGILAGLWFAREFTHDGPPFGGNWEEYEPYFAPYFKTLTCEICNKSIKPRLGNEYFIRFEKQ